MLDVDCCSPWQNPDEAILRGIFEQVLKLSDGLSLLHRCSCVCTTWRKISMEVLLDDTAASKPDFFNGGMYFSMVYS